jgi:hypothetical protein
MDKFKAWLQRARAAVAARVVDDWRHLHRFYSVKIAALGAAMLTAWEVMPDKAIAFLPHWIPSVAAYATLIGVIAGVLAKQDFSRRPPPNGGADA